MRKYLKNLWVVCGIMLGALMMVFPVLALESGVGDEIEDVLPEVFIKAVNPGYTIDGISNVGEMIEIGRKDSDALASLAGLTVGYTNSSGKYAVLAEFPENSFMVGETILLRLASSPEHELANLNYSKTLAFKAGPLVLMRGEKVIDSVCWTGKDECYKEFKSAEPTVLVRDLVNGEFQHAKVGEYETVFNEDNYRVDTMAEDDGLGKAPQCKGLIFSELLSYYEETQKEQFVEFYNSTAEQILLDGCQVRYKNKVYPLSGIVKPEEYKVRYLIDFSVTKNPTNVGILELVDVNDEVIDKLEYPNGQRKGTTWALIGYDASGGEIWRMTYAPTPGEANNYQEFRTCEEGKVINEATGNCVKVVEVVEKTCPAGQYLNPLTNRCKTIEVAKSEVVCKEGYYLNEETGRCRKIIENNGADYSLVTEVYEEKSSFVALYAVLGVIGLGLIYVIWQFKSEIRRLFGKVFRRFH